MGSPYCNIRRNDIQYMQAFFPAENNRCGTDCFSIGGVVLVYESLYGLGLQNSLDILLRMLTDNDYLRQPLH
jgi:hypothetical protein